MTSSQLHVLIIGAGATGLLLAQALEQEGIRYSIFEKEPSKGLYRAREWGVSIQWALPLLAECLPKEKFDRLHETAVDPSYVPEDPGVFPTFHGGTGKWIKNIPLVYMYRVSRNKFRALCHEEIEVQYGKSLTSFHYDDDSMITAIFEDGTQVSGNIIVGTDGVRSAVRQCAFDSEKGLAARAPYIVISLDFCYKDATKALFLRKNHPILYHAIHPDGFWLWISVQDIPDPTDPVNWKFQLLVTCPQCSGFDPKTLRLADLKLVAKTFGEPFRSAWLWLPDDTPFFANNMSFWEPDAWYNREGRVTLAGDAGHAMTVQRGQGMNNGIADVVKLRNALRLVRDDKTSLKDAINAYQAEMIARGGNEVRLSRQQTEMVHNWALALESPLMKEEACFPQAVSVQWQ